MEISSVPIIIIICYVIGEIYKVIFKNKQTLYKLIPMLVVIIGGVLGILIYLTNKELIFNSNNIWTSLTIGMISGASATSTNQIIKQIFKKEQGEQNVKLY